MREHHGARPLQEWALLTAYLPSLLLLGHWEPRLVIPGTPWSAVLLPAPHSGDVPEDHARHCHGDAAGCSDVPLTVATAIALAGETIAFLGAASPFVPLNARWWLPLGAMAIAPELPPPRPFLACL